MKIYTKYGVKTLAGNVGKKRENETSIVEPISGGMIKLDIKEDDNNDKDLSALKNIIVKQDKPLFKNHTRKNLKFIF